MGKGKRFEIVLGNGRRLVVEGEYVTIYCAAPDDFGTMHYRRELRQRTRMGADGHVMSAPEVAERSLLAAVVADLAARLSMALAIRGMATESTEGAEGNGPPMEGMDGDGARKAPPNEFGGGTGEACNEGAGS